MKWARIENGRVTETTEYSPEGRYPSSLCFIPCGQEVEEGWRWESDSFYAPEEAHSAALSAAEKHLWYQNICKGAIAEEYPIEDEIKLLRRELRRWMETGECSEEFEEYYDYAEMCIHQAQARVYGNAE